MSIIKFFVRNPVLVNLIMVVTVVAGFVYYNTIPRDVFPEFTKDAINITTEYIGASPEDIEKLVTIKIEDAIADIDGVDDINSTSREGVSTIIVKLKRDAKDVNRVITDIKSEIDTIKSDLPEDAEDSRVKELKGVFPVITISLFSELPELSMKKLAEDLKDDINDIPGVGKVILSGVRERQIHVEITPERLEKYNLTLDYIKQVIKSKNLNMPGGTLKTDAGEKLIRILGEINEKKELENIILRSNTMGNNLFLHQVATIKDEFEDPKILGRFNGKKSVNLSISKDKNGNIIEIAENIHQFVERYKKTLPPGVSIETMNDFSVFVKNRLNTMKRSGAIGLSLVLLTLCILLNFRTALLTAWGIPVSFLGSVILMNFYGMSLNMLSMFSFILVLGMVVDDAIVVSENVYSHIEKGSSPETAALNGTAEVAAPVITTVLTTIAAFIPMLLMPGTTGKFMSVIPVIVIFTLSVSIIEALIILPSHLADFLSPAYVKRTMTKTEKPWFEKIKVLYSRFLRFTLNWRYVFLSISIAITVILIAFAIKFIPIVFFGEFESDQFFINIETDISSDLESTSDLLKKVETVVLALPENELKSLSTNVGMILLQQNSSTAGSNLGQLIVELTDKAERDRSSEEIITFLRAKIQNISKISKLQFLRRHGGPGGPAIEIAVAGPEISTRVEIANRLKKDLAAFPAVQDIRDDATLGKKEMKIFLKEEARSLNLDIKSIAVQIQHSFRGTESSRIQRSREEIPIMVKYPDSNTKEDTDLENMKITTKSGDKVFFSEVAYIIEGQGYTKISRDDRKRITTVFTDINKKKGTSNEVIDEIMETYKPIMEQYPGYKLVVKGERKDFIESIKFLRGASLAAMLLIYLILGALFKSYIQPIIVMFAIPFAIDGVIIGHYVMGNNISLLSLLGLIALAGVVVNDSLILVDFINKKSSQCESLMEATILAANQRIRPILLTSITTVAGLTPLAFFATGQARFLAPMAISLVWGLSFATILTLLIIPCLYLVVDDVKNIFV